MTGRIALLLAAGSLAAFLASAADAACPHLMQWRHTTWRMAMMNNGQPRPAHGRLIARTRLLDLRCIAVPLSKPGLVSVYALPKIDPHVAYYQEGGHGPWAVFVRRGWKVRPNTPLWRLLHQPR